MHLYHTTTSEWKIAESDICFQREITVQARSKGSIFILCSFTEKLEEIHSVPLVRELIRISVPIIWLGSCHTNFHKTIKNPN